VTVNILQVNGEPRTRLSDERTSRHVSHWPTWFKPLRIKWLTGRQDRRQPSKQQFATSGAVDRGIKTINEMTPQPCPRQSCDRISDDRALHTCIQAGVDFLKSTARSHPKLYPVNLNVCLCCSNAQRFSLSIRLGHFNEPVQNEAVWKRLPFAALAVLTNRYQASVESVVVCSDMVPTQCHNRLAESSFGWLSA
jgi:hypothetical protein